jgi:hypothetical protein
MKSYQVQLTPAERQHLEKLTSSGIAPARKLTRARIVLQVDAGLTKTAVSLVLDVDHHPHHHALSCLSNPQT